ncbi:unnamed protein product [Chironomus riparius]|uniref:Uncharacterized protein n=1 Tax=Chironomus riparius TaxID=315576 RepID=A0A9N9S7F0_9DIPT|nr:unnamed protein product [Chironomus riparius]
MTRDFKLFRGLFLLKIVKSNCIVVLLFFAIYESSRSADIKCQFGDTGGFAVVGMAYLCTFYNANISSEESAKINNVTGRHENLKTHDDVLGFYSTGNQVINYFPQGLDKFFINIKTIALYSSNLKEIHQADLKPFPKLIYLNLYANDLEILEEGLLDFNPDLKVVGFQQNKLFHIDSNVFDGLKKLSYLWLVHVPCISKNAMTSIEVQASIATIKDKCTSSEFTSLNLKITNLENKSKTLSPDLLRV